MVELVKLTAPDNQPCYINPALVTEVRPNTHDYDKHAKTVIQMRDGKAQAVIEDVLDVVKALGANLGSAS